MTDTRKKWLTVLFIFMGTLSFGFIDNFIMVIAGEVIDTYISGTFGFSTMASAGLGNAFSDVIGVMVQGTLTGFLVKVFKDTDESIVPRWLNITAGSVGIGLGCVIGLCPLWF